MSIELRLLHCTLVLAEHKNFARRVIEFSRDVRRRRPPGGLSLVLWGAGLPMPLFRVHSLVVWLSKSVFVKHRMDRTWLDCSSSLGLAEDLNGHRDANNFIGFPTLRQVHRLQ